MTDPITPPVRHRAAWAALAAAIAIVAAGCGESTSLDAADKDTGDHAAATQRIAAGDAPGARRPAPKVRPMDADAAFAKYVVGDSLEAVFAAVAGNISYEPYPGAQRGAKGTALAGSGNALDKATLLASALDGQVAAVRYARGRLSIEQLTILLSSFNPRYSGDRTLAPDTVTLYDPSADHTLHRIVRDHVWLEVQREQGGDWLALDPTFPGARPGDAVMESPRHFDTLPTSLVQSFNAIFMQQTADGKTQRIGRVSGTVADLALFPIAYVVRGVPQFEGDRPASRKGGGMSGGGGLLGGGALQGGKTEEDIRKDDNAARQIVATEYRRELTFGGSAPTTLPAATFVHDKPRTAVVREWVDFRLRAPGGINRKFSRDLFEADADGSRPATVRRYSIALVNGRVSQAAFEGFRAKLDRKGVQHAQTQLATLRNADAGNEAALQLLQIESAHALTPHLINLAFAYESDALTERLARGASVSVVHELPRVLITSIETRLDANGDVHTDTTLDLRLDEVRAVPYTGFPQASARLFQRARGMSESALEGRVLSRFVADPDSVVTTARVMAEAQTQGQLLALAVPEQRGALATLKNLPERAAQRIEAALDAGRQIIVPTGAAIIDGAQHWGWWEVDAASGAFVGVLASGQHQAMTQYTVTLEEIGVNDGMGYVIGALVGSTATITLYSAKMIEYGHVTPQLIAEVAAGIERLTCVTCPQFEVVASPMQASASFQSQCLEQTGVGVGLGAGMSGGLAFCQNYKLGISCAASLMLGTFEVQGDTTLGPNFALDLGPLGCD